jgi:hypothetical protein
VGEKDAMCTSIITIALDNILSVHIESICNVTYLFTVTTQKGASW